MKHLAFGLQLDPNRGPRPGRLSGASSSHRHQPVGGERHVVERHQQLYFDGERSEPGPTLIPPPDRVIHAGTTISVDASATDPDLPVNTFTYGKVSGPAGVTVNAAGLVTWNTGDADANSTNTITLKVTDSGSPSLSHTNNFVVTIRSRPVFTLFEFAGSSATAEWTAISGASYRLQYRTNIGGATWADLAGDVVAGGSTATKTDTTPGTNATRFYRVYVLP